MLTLSTEQVNRIIELAREYEAHTAPAEDELNLTEEDAVDGMGGAASHPLVEWDTLQAAIEDLNDDEQFQLVALMWVGRGTYDVEDWDEALGTAKAEATHSPAEYLMGTPLLADHLVNGLDALPE